jgi:hypothetical protein
MKKLRGSVILLGYPVNRPSKIKGPKKRDNNYFRPEENDKEKLRLALE